MTNETGTLEELNVKPGDVVEYAGRTRYTVLAAHMLKDEEGDRIHYGFLWSNAPHFTIISRAAPDPLPHGHVTMQDGRTVDLTANRVRCDLMDPDELQAMKGHGGPYEIWGEGKWDEWKIPAWTDWSTYRVAPKPVVETVVLCYRRDSGTVKNRIGTINLIDGKPDMASIIDTKTEEL